MSALDRLYTRWPFYGVRRMTLALHDQGWSVNHKRTRLAEYRSLLLLLQRSAAAQQSCQSVACCRI